MSTLFIAEIGQLVTFRGAAGPRTGANMRELGIIENAGLIAHDGKILACGKMSEIKNNPLAREAETIEACGAVVIPGFCDSHTHPVFAAPRIKDFALRASGADYAAIKASGGGIISSVKGVREATESALKKKIVERAEKFLMAGTTTIEAKSGYGLTKEAEIKSLRAIKHAAAECPLAMVPTLLAAHSVPPEFSDADSYVKHIIEEIIPAVSAEKLAVFADIFCESGFFTAAHVRAVMDCAKNNGLRPKVHAEQFTHCGGIEAAVACGALSVDHADCADSRDIEQLNASGTVATLLPASNHFLGLSKFPPARELIDGGAAVALATDFNPGTAPCWNMQFVLSLACTHMGMTPEEALCAATVNGACAMGLGGSAGRIEVGLPADFAIMDVDDYRELCYYFGDNMCVMTVKNGESVYISG